MKLSNSKTVEVWLPIKVRDAIAISQGKPHLVIVQDSEECVFYVNGEMAASEKIREL